MISNVFLQETLGLTKLEAVAGSISTKAITENSGEWAGMESLIISQPENVTEWSEGKVVMERNRFCKSEPKKMTTSPRVEEIQLTSSLDINKN